MLKGSKSNKGPRRDLTGQEFGHLKVLQMVLFEPDSTTKHRAWGVACVCSCGKGYSTRNISALRKGNIKSCGCSPDRSAKVLGSKNISFRGYEGITSRFWYDINSRAERRGYKLELTIEEAWEVYQQQKGLCALSGLPIVFGRVDYPRETTASMDRIDSNGKYELGNIQWVHKSVNIMKNVFKQDYFVNFCRRIVAHMSVVPQLTDVQMLEQYMSKDYIEKHDEQVRIRGQRARDKKKEQNEN